MTKPVYYVEPTGLASYPFADDGTRVGWGVRPVVGAMLSVFPSKHQAEDHSSQFDQGEVIEVEMRSTDDAERERDSLTGST